jgi:hypothetical protein
MEILAVEDLATTNPVAAVLPGRVIAMVIVAGVHTAHRGAVGGVITGAVTADIAALLELISAAIDLDEVTDTQAGAGSTVGVTEDFSGPLHTVVSHIGAPGIDISLATAVSAGPITEVDSAMVLAGTEDSCDTMRGVSVFIDGTGCIARHTRAARRGMAISGDTEHDLADLPRADSGWGG